MATKINWDIPGVATAALRTIHSALLPMLASALPVFRVDLIDNTFFEWGMIGPASLAGSYSIFHGYAKYHHFLTPISIFSAGCKFLVMKQFFHPIKNWFLICALPLIIWRALFDLPVFLSEQMCTHPS